MKKIVFIMLFALVLSGCGKEELEVESLPTPTPAPEFMVQEYFSSEEMDSELQFIEYSYGFIGFQFYLPSEWHYGILEYNSHVGEHGIDFWPSGSGGEVLSLRYYPEPFGVCGTGLVEAEGELPGTGKLRVGYYDGQDYPSFISFYDAPGAWVLTNDLGEGWNAHWPEIEKILGSLVLDPGVIRVSEAEETAIAWSDADYDYLRTSFDVDSGCISVWFTRMGGEITDIVNMDPSGGIFNCIGEPSE